MASTSPGAGVRVSRATAVVVQRVPASAVDWFLDWQREVTRAAEAFPGFSGSELFPPREGAGDQWVALIHFEDEPALARWLDSPERASRIQALRARVGEFDLKTLGGGFGPWFAGLAQPGGAAAPPGWKMVLSVVLGLYPTVMLLTIFVGPWTNPLGLAVSMLIGNALSVSILQWGVMPALTALLGPWLQAGESGKPGLRLGTPAAVLLVLAAMVLLFRLVTG